jgi:branched-subunit amino acid aminotransferase/4-amino-4-deoxychorismate lyase
MLGDGMWEGMRLYDGVWAFFDEHMDRFFDSCKTVSLDPGMDRAGIFEALEMTRAANGMETDVHCRLMLTRGVKVRPFQHPAQPVGSDARHHHGAFEARGPVAGARHQAGHRAAGARAADEPGSPSSTAIPSSTASSPACRRNRRVRTRR